MAITEHLYAQTRPRIQFGEVLVGRLRKKLGTTSSGRAAASATTSARKSTDLLALPRPPSDRRWRDLDPGGAGSGRDRHRLFLRRQRRRARSLRSRCDAQPAGRRDRSRGAGARLGATSAGPALRHTVRRPLLASDRSRSRRHRCLAFAVGFCAAVAARGACRRASPICSGSRPGRPDADRADTPRIRYQAQNKSYVAAVAEDRAPLSATISEFGGQLAGALIILGAVLIAAAWLQVTLGLRPLSAVRAGIERVRSGRETALKGNYRRKCSRWSSRSTISWFRRRPRSRLPVRARPIWPTD